MNNDFESKLKRNNINTLISIIYIFIVISSLYANFLDYKFIYTKNKLYYKKEKNVNINSAIISFLIYLYFFYIAIIDYEKRKNNKYKNIEIISLLQFISSFLFLIGGALEIYLEIKTNDSDEVAFI